MKRSLPVMQNLCMFHCCHALCLAAKQREKCSEHRFKNIQSNQCLRRSRSVSSRLSDIDVLRKRRQTQAAEKWCGKRQTSTNTGVRALHLCLCLYKDPEMKSSLSDLVAKWKSVASHRSPAQLKALNNRGKKQNDWGDLWKHGGSRRIVNAVSSRPLQHCFVGGVSSNYPSAWGWLINE